MHLPELWQIRNKIEIRMANIDSSSSEYAFLLSIVQDIDYLIATLEKR